MQTFIHCNFAILVRIFMKFSTKCRTKKLRMTYTILGSFCSFWNWEGTDIQSQIRPRKIPVSIVSTVTNSYSTNIRSRERIIHMNVAGSGFKLITS